MQAKRLLLALVNASSLILAGLVASGNEIIFRENSELSESKQPRSALLVSTLDGELTALEERTGRVMWRIPSSEPLLSSSLSAIKSAADLKNPHYVPSLDGNLFQWNGEKVEALPMTASMLLGKTFRGPDGMHVVGSNDLSIYGIDPSSGKIRYVCSSSGCQPTEQDASHLSNKQMLVVKRSQQTVRTFDERTGSERWNFSVGSYDLEFVQGIDSHLYTTDDPCADNSIPRRAPLSIKFDIPNGEVFATDSDGTTQWTAKMKTPIAASWRLGNTSLQPVDLFEDSFRQSAEDDDGDDMMYLGIYEGQMYIHKPESKERKSLDDSSGGGSDATDVVAVNQPYIGSWRPYVSSSPSRTPFLNNDNGLTVFNSLDYPFDNGFYIMGDSNSKALQVSYKPVESSQKNDHKMCETEGSKSGDEDDTPQDGWNETVGDGGPASVVPLSLFDWWKEILVVSAIFSIAANLIFRWAKMKLALCREQVTELLQESEGVRQQAQTATTTISTTTGARQSTPTLGTSEQSASSASLSRYNSEFEHVQYLGKGGFGVVFRAKNKVDDCEYAVKRICIPNCELAKEKVMREVKALARLDHSGIVRYFNSWWEVPSGETQHSDEFEMMQFNSTALSNDWYVEVQNTLEFQGRSSGRTTSNDDIKDLLMIKDRTRQSSSTGSRNSIAQDPMGRRFNMQTGVEDVTEPIDLLAHNDVFHSDEDSFSVEFENSSDDEASSSDHLNTTAAESDSGHGVDDVICTCDNDLSWATLDGRPCAKCTRLHDETTSKADSRGRSKKNTKIVGRCCEKSMECLTAQPLHLYIQMQLCRKETLKEWLHETCGKRTRQQAYVVFNQIVLAVAYVHSKGMMHRDLKPKNIFFAMDYTVKVGDFGLVTAVMRPSDGQSKGALVGDGHTGRVGTELYMSPEQITGKPYSHKVDIYSLGLILVELLLSFTTEMERVTNLLQTRQGRLPEEFEETYPEETAFIKSLIAEDPKQRPEASEIMQHALLRSSNNSTNNHVRHPSECLTSSVSPDE